MSEPKGPRRRTVPKTKGKSGPGSRNRAAGGGRNHQKQVGKDHPVPAGTPGESNIEELLEQQCLTAKAKEAEAKDRIRREIAVTKKGPLVFQLVLSQAQLDVVAKVGLLSERDLTSLLVDAIGQGIRGIERDLPMLELVDWMNKPERAVPTEPIKLFKPIKQKFRKLPEDLYGALRTMCSSWSRKELERLELKPHGSLMKDIGADREIEAYIAAALLQEAAQCAKIAEDVAHDIEERGMILEAGGARAVASRLRDRHPEPKPRRSR